MPESGEAEFQLIFPPLDRGIVSIDLMEDEKVQGGFCIWGIQLDGDLPKLKIPKDVRQSECMYVDSLPEVELKTGVSTVKGKILDYKPSMGKNIRITAVEQPRRLLLSLARPSGFTLI